ncbi:uncharacterized protein CELE_ZK673.1 [Caenorhabditis elegans]|uniref:Uncharacterized protein n=1 Tax=Caenorhabditis elegans TaxID=6239 RepID=B7WN75_CAEEL|nr:Uncharacterized protein CELE_ZK673.1 [Caenorhabditis elegans]CAT01105.1 Uncharacterized protein CELE_ZK673.1 [Caenorhabditis elegans]|eukprot:NP_001254249.1 Uncharacterized protein CELE_ZK673.1 [Caenorhabditis elegans]
MIRTQIAPNIPLCAQTPSILHYSSNFVQRPVDSVVVDPLLLQSNAWIAQPTAPTGKKTASAHRHSTTVPTKNNTVRRRVNSVRQHADHRPGTYTRARSVFPSKSVNILLVWLLASFVFYLGFFLFLAQ